MLVLCDTGILLRVLDTSDPRHTAIAQAMNVLRTRGDIMVTAPQNLIEFRGVSTRPASARGGYGLSLAETERRAAHIEFLFGVLPDEPAVYLIWRQVVSLFRVSGVQVHDARLVAWMHIYGIRHMMTLNGKDFARYTHLTVWSPEEVAAQNFSPEAAAP